MTVLSLADYGMESARVTVHPDYASKDSLISTFIGSVRGFP